MENLEKMISGLKASDDVDAVFVTGSAATTGTKHVKPYSDIDLVIVLKENALNLYSLYRWIDGAFADIFFFDLVDLKRIQSEAGKDSNAMDGVFMSWLKNADIRFDKSGALTALKNKADNSGAPAVSIKEKQDFWQKINYNFVANKRYFESGDPLYHQALEMRLLYSVIETICGYLALRNVPWRGEKNAVSYLTTYHPDFYKLFQKYSASQSLKERFEYYSQMVGLVFTDEYKQWTSADEVLIKKDFSIAGKNDPATNYVAGLLKA